MNWIELWRERLFGYRRRVFDEKENEKAKEEGV